MTGNRNQINCLEGAYTHHYTTIATEWVSARISGVKYLMHSSSLSLWLMHVRDITGTDI